MHFNWWHVSVVSFQNKDGLYYTLNIINYWNDETCKIDEWRLNWGGLKRTAFFYIHTTLTRTGRLWLPVGQSRHSRLGGISICYIRKTLPDFVKNSKLGCLSAKCVHFSACTSLNQTNTSNYCFDASLNKNVIWPEFLVY